LEWRKCRRKCFLRDVNYVHKSEKQSKNRRKKKSEITYEQGSEGLLKRGTNKGSKGDKQRVTRERERDHITCNTVPSERNRIQLCAI
jgi:hypothetical protein